MAAIDTCDKWIEQPDFPADCKGGITTGMTWIHPTTGAVYTYSEDKNSWMMMADVGTRTYSQTYDPQFDGVSPTVGDMWWDQNLLELRVWHQPEPKPGETYAGHWVSSTNPQMSGIDTDRNETVGYLELIPPGNWEDIVEDYPTEWRVTRTGGCDESKIEYEWFSSPPDVSYTVNGVEQTFTVDFNPKDAPVTTVVFPEGTYVTDGDFVQRYGIYCQVRAKEQYADGFAVPKQNTKKQVIIPGTKPNDSLDYLIVTTSKDAITDDVTIELNDGSSTVTKNSTNDYSSSIIPFNGKFFLMYPGDDDVDADGPLVISNVDYTTYDGSQDIGILGDYDQLVGQPDGTYEGFLVDIGADTDPAGYEIFIWHNSGDATADEATQIKLTLS